MNSYVCMCERVTVEDVERAIDMGFRDVESLKRYLRIGMGPCQGRYCVPIVLGILSRKLGVPVEKLSYVAIRPPLEPVPARLFLRVEKDV